MTPAQTAVDRLAQRRPTRTAASPTPELPAVSGGLSTGRRLVGALLLVVGLPVLTELLVQYRDDLAYATPVLLALTLVVLTSLVGGLWVALPAAVLGALTLNWFFTPPYGTLAVTDPGQLVVLAVFLAVAVVVAVIVDVAARQTAAARRARAEASALSTLAGATLAEARTLPDLLERVRTTFGMRRVELLEPVVDGVVADGTVTGGMVTGGMVIAAAAGNGPPEADEVELRVSAGHGVVLSARGPALFAEDHRLLASFAEAAGTALEGRRLAEEAQATAEAQARLEAADRMRAALLASVGHDLRTPLAGIKAAASSLRQPDVAFSDEDRADLLETIESSADRLHTLVTNVLDASRVQAGALTVRPAALPVDEVVNAVLAAVPQEERARLTVELPRDLPPVVADGPLLERVLTNLVDNALHYSPPHTPVVVRAVLSGLFVSVSVIDHGPGVPAGEVDQMFRPFQRLDDRTPGGIGLGLAVARGFTEAMNGTLTAESTPGGGMTMVVRLPARPGVSAGTVST